MRGRIFDNKQLHIFNSSICFVMRFPGSVGLARQIGELDGGTHYEGGTSVSIELRVRQEICGACGAAREESVKLR